MQINSNASLTSAAPITLQSGSTLTLQAAAAVTVSSQLTAVNSTINGSGVVHLTSSSHFYAGCSVSASVYLPSGIHTLYDPDQLQWQPISLAVGDPNNTCATGGSCANRPTLLLTPSVALYALQAATSSVLVYLSSITFHGVGATLSVASMYLLNVGAVDGVAYIDYYHSYSLLPSYTIQSADQNRTTVQVTSNLTASALSMTLRHVQLQVYVLPNIYYEATTTLLSSSQLVFTQGSQLQLSLVASSWEVEAGDSSAGQGVWLPYQTAIQLSGYVYWSLSVPLVAPSVTSISLSDGAHVYIEWWNATALLSISVRNSSYLYLATYDVSAPALKSISVDMDAAFWAPEFVTAASLRLVVGNGSSFYLDGLNVSSSTSISIGSSADIEVSALTLQDATLLIPFESSLYVSGTLVAHNSTVSAVGWMRLAGSSRFYAGCSVSGSVHFDTGSHTLYDPEKQSWQNASLTLFSPVPLCYPDCDAVILTITPSAPSVALQTPTSSVPLYFASLTLVGTFFPYTLSVASMYLLSIGFMDAIVTYLDGPYLAVPDCVIQSADANRSTIVVSFLTASTLSATLIHATLVVYSAAFSNLYLPTGVYSAAFSDLYLTSSSALVIPVGGVLTVGSTSHTSYSPVSLTIDLFGAGNAVENFGLLNVTANATLAVSGCFINNGTLSVAAPTALTLNASVDACIGAPEAFPFAVTTGAAGAPSPLPGGSSSTLSSAAITGAVVGTVVGAVVIVVVGAVVLASLKSTAGGAVAGVISQAPASNAMIHHPSTAGPGEGEGSTSAAMDTGQSSSMSHLSHTHSIELQPPSTPQSPSSAPPTPHSPYSAPSVDTSGLLEPILTLSPIAAALNMSEDPLSRQKLLTHTNVGLLEVSPLKRQGTVILVSRHLCITAGHTVEDEKQAAEATVTFSSLAPDAQPLGTVTARLRPDLLFISSHAEDEVKKQREDAGSPLDFTLVAIDLPADVAGSVPRLGLETLLAPSATQLAVQAGRTQVQVVGCLASKCDGKPSAYDARPVIRYGNEGEDDWRYPLHYGTSTLPGHSGGAVVDAATWQLLAMHQRFGRDENCNVGLLLRVLFHHVMRIHDSPRELSRRATSGHVDTPQLQQLRQERIDELHRVAQSQL